MPAVSITTISEGALNWAVVASLTSMGMATLSAGQLLLSAAPGFRDNSMVTTSAGELLIAASPNLRDNSMRTASAGELLLAASPGLRVNSMVTVSPGALLWTSTERRAIGFLTPSAGALLVAAQDEVGMTLDWVMQGTTVKCVLRQNPPSALTVFDAAREVYNLWRIEITDPRQIEFARERVLAYINTAVQTMHARAHLLDYFTRAPLTVTITGGTSSVALPDSVQVVRGPVKLETNNLPLRQVMTRTDLDLFGAYFFGESPLPSAPRAFYLDAANQNSADNVKLTLHVTPPPVDNTNLILDVAHEPARYTAGDIYARKALQVPAKFAETIFWPLLRYAAAGDNLFKTETLRPDIDAKYKAAAVTLGLVAPNPPEATPKKAAA
jgi:hypothetical protein